MFSWFLCFTAKLFSFSCIRFLVYFRVISSNLFVEFSFVVLECPVLSILFSPFVEIFLIFLFFPRTFWFISSCCIVIFSCATFSFLSQHLPAFFFCFIIFTSFCRFLICVFSRISYPGFDFLFVLLKGTLIFLQTNFAPAQISSNSVMFFAEIYVSTSLIFYISVLTILHSMFLTDGKVVFSIHNSL